MIGGDYEMNRDIWICYGHRSACLAVCRRLAGCGHANRDRDRGHSDGRACHLYRGDHFANYRGCDHALDLLICHCHHDCSSKCLEPSIVWSCLLLSELLHSLEAYKTSSQVTRNQQPASTMEEIVNYYEVLQVAQTANKLEIQTAYKARALERHPDKNPDLPNAADLFHQTKVARDALLDPETRAKLDQHLKAKEMRNARDQQMSEQRKQMKRKLDENEKRGAPQVALHQKQKAEADKIRQETQKLWEKFEAQVRSERRAAATTNATAAPMSPPATPAESPAAPIEVKANWNSAVNSRVTGGKGVTVEYLKDLFRPYGIVDYVRRKKTKSAVIGFRSSTAGLAAADSPPAGFKITVHEATGDDLYEMERVREQLARDAATAAESAPVQSAAGSAANNAGDDNDDMEVDQSGGEEDMEVDVPEEVSKPRAGCVGWYEEQVLDFKQWARNVADKAVGVSQPTTLSALQERERAILQPLLDPQFQFPIDSAV